MKQKKTFIKLIQLWGVILIIGVAVSITVIDIIGSYLAFTRQSEKIRQNYIAHQKQIIKQEVMRVVDLIAYEKSQSERLTKQQIKTRVNEAYSIAQNIYLHNQATKSTTEIQQMILDALRPIRFNDGSGYYYAVRLDGVGIFFADRPEMDGKFLLNIQDTHGQYIVKESIELVKKTGEGFYTYYWTKPNSIGDNFKKISFIKLFKPYNWYFGAGLYVDDVEKQIKTNLLKSISKIRFGKEGYIFINRLNGDALVSNGQIVSGTKKLWEFFNKNPEKIKAVFDKEYTAASKPEGDYIYYSHIKLTTPDIESPKASFIYGIPDLQWLVGAGVYLDDVETDISSLQAELTKQIKEKIFFFPLIALATLIFFLFLFSQVSRRLKNDIHLLSAFFKQAAFSNESINRDLIHFEELDQMAKNANKMLRDKAQVEKQLNMFKTFAESSNQGMGWADSDGNIEYVNSALAALFGENDQTSPLGKNVVTTYYPEKEQQKLKEEIFPRVIKNGDWAGELTIRQINGKLIPTHNNFFRIHNETMDPIFFANIVTDITERKKAEKEKDKLTEKLHQAKKMESIGLMAGGVAHDLNNILSGIVGYPELILQNLAKDSELREPIEAIHQSGQRAATVVADLLTVARGVASTREPCDLNLLIEEYLNSPEGIKLKSLYPNIIYKHEVKAENADIACSPVHVKKCIMNLVTNASEAIIDNGTVIISTHNHHVNGAAHIKQKIECGEYVVLCIQDTGPGISNENLKHIFEPFYSKKVMGHSGTGLGLTVVWNTVKDHDGKIFVDSGDNGTSFRLYFPVNKQEKVIQPTDSKSEELRGNNQHILIVDDEAQLRDIASRMLIALGYNAVAVSSGEAAIDFVKKTPVDLIVIDMLMEPGMNGCQTYEEIIKSYPNQKAIIASGFSESDEVKKSLQLGAGGFIKKPYSMKQLGLAVKEALQE
jgi:PAS domain S-box-containing protein